MNILLWERLSALKHYLSVGEVFSLETLSFCGRGFQASTIGATSPSHRREREIGRHGGLGEALLVGEAVSLDRFHLWERLSALKHLFLWERLPSLEDRGRMPLTQRED